MDNHDLTDLQRLVLSRRRFIGTGALAGAALFLAGSPLGRTALANAISARPLLGFDNIAASTADTITLPPGYRFDVLISWGQPLHQTPQPIVATAATAPRSSLASSARTTTA